MKEGGCASVPITKKFHATGVTSEGSKAAQPLHVLHVEIYDKQRLIDVGPSGG